MTTNTGLPVSGYRPQSDKAVAIVNENKAAEERILRKLDSLAQDPAVDRRRLAIARTNIEQGFMAMNRAVFQPARVALPERGQHPAALPLRPAADWHESE